MIAIMEEQMKTLLAYDGSIEAKDILRCWLQKERCSMDRLTVLHVFNSGLFAGYDAIPGTEAMARTESDRSVAEARQIILDAGDRISARIVEEEGVPSEEILRYAENQDMDMLLCPRRYRNVPAQWKKVRALKEKEFVPSVMFEKYAGTDDVPAQRFS
jgi:nucleotide-binding universal stress UspA family protein